jgi:hypothetical protein
MKLIHVTGILSLLFLASCAEKPAEKVDVYEIRNIGLLSTTEYTLGKVVKLKDNKEWYKYGDRNILISCKAKVKAGIDLTTIAAEDIQVDGSRIAITLPAPVVLSLTMDPDQIHVEIEEVNGFRLGFSQDEKNKILALGERSIRANLSQTNILQTAQKNARIFAIDFYKQLGFDEVTVTFKQAPNGQEIKSL